MVKKKSNGLTLKKLHHYGDWASIGGVVVGILAVGLTIYLWAYPRSTGKGVELPPEMVKELYPRSQAALGNPLVAKLSLATVSVPKCKLETSGN
jgi:hypothetical protein